MLLPTTLQELRVRTDHGTGRIGPVPRLALPTFMATMETFGRLHPEYDLAPLSERTPRYVGSLIIAQKQTHHTCCTVHERSTHSTTTRTVRMRRGQSVQ